MSRLLTCCTNLNIVVSPQSTTLLTDSVLEVLSQHLTRLESLYLVGCPKVTHKGLWSILSSNSGSLSGLGMETLSPLFVSMIHRSPFVAFKLKSFVGHGQIFPVMQGLEGPPFTTRDQHEY